MANHDKLKKNIMLSIFKQNLIRYPNQSSVLCLLRRYLSLHEDLRGSGSTSLVKKPGNGPPACLRLQQTLQSFLLHVKLILPVGELLLLVGEPGHLLAQPQVVLLDLLLPPLLLLVFQRAPGPIP